MLIKFINLILFIVPLGLCGQQKGLLEVYTKKGCGNCEATKTFLTEQNINYTELKVENDNNGPQMVKRLRFIGYKGRIFMPVVFIDSVLVFPAVENDTGFGYRSLNSLLDTLSSHISIQQNQATINSSNKSSENNVDSGCEYGDSAVYHLVVKSFKHENEAKEYVKKLRESGYANASYFMFNRQFRVSIISYTSKEEAGYAVTHYNKTFMAVLVFKQ